MLPGYPFSTCVTPGISRNTSRRGTLYIIYKIYVTKYQTHFLWTFARFSPAPVGLSRALGCRARRGATCTPRRKFGSRVGSMARALGVRSREMWRVITGSLSAELEPSKSMETFISALLLHCSKRSLLCGSHGTTAHNMFVWTTTMRV